MNLSKIPQKSLSNPKQSQKSSEILRNPRKSRNLFKKRDRQTNTITIFTIRICVVSGVEKLVHKVLRFMALNRLWFCFFFKSSCQLVCNTVVNSFQGHALMTRGFCGLRWHPNKKVANSKFLIAIPQMDQSRIGK